MEALLGTIMRTDLHSTYKLFQLTSPNLPTGAFTYSQGLEWGVENGWITGKESLSEWLESILYSGYAELEIPLLKRLYLAVKDDDLKAFEFWSSYLLASRETKELRQEEMHRGRATFKILTDLNIAIESGWEDAIKKCQAAGYALAAVRWNIGIQQAVLGYTWGWLENMVMAAVKIIPIGQAAGQQVLAAIVDQTVDALEQGLAVEDVSLGGSCPAMVISSCLHETQYTRLFRS